MRFFVIGAGLWGCVMARLIADDLRCDVEIIERRPHIGGNCHSFIDAATGIECHAYGSHIFHTSLPKVYAFISRFTDLTAYRHKVLATCKGKAYPMPVNLWTINSFLGKDMRPGEALAYLARQKDGSASPRNFEEQAIAMVGAELYEAFIKGYTEKQWGRRANLLPAALAERIPARCNYDINYFSDLWQGMPREGYFTFFQRLLDSPHIHIRLNCSFEAMRASIPSDAKIIYTGMPDALFGYAHGALEWRSLRFEWETLPLCDFQGTAVMNSADADIPYTRVHEFKHYHPERQEVFASAQTVICREYPHACTLADEAYYPVNDERNEALYAKYKARADADGIMLGGRLGCYRYWDMDKAIGDALEKFEILTKQEYYCQI